MQTLVEKINQRRRQLLVHAFLYYRLNTSTIDDHTYDRFALDLIQLQEEHGKIAESCIYADAFRGFKMGDSFGLPLHDPHVQEMALRYLRAREAYLNK